MITAIITSIDTSDKHDGGYHEWVEVESYPELYDRAGAVQEPGKTLKVRQVSQELFDDPEGPEMYSLLGFY